MFKSYFMQQIHKAIIYLVGVCIFYVRLYFIVTREVAQYFKHLSAYAVNRRIQFRLAAAALGH